MVAANRPNDTCNRLDIHFNTCSLCGAWQGQYGLEATYQDYIAHSVLWAKEAWRVLKDDGLFFLNIGDSYPSGGGKAVEQSFKRQSAIESGAYPDNNPSANLRKSMPKCQLLIPHRVAMSLIDEGWILRNTIVWYKPNSMPESVTDRFSKKYEYVFMFSKQKNYYFNLDAVRESFSNETFARCKRGYESDDKVYDENYNSEKHKNHAIKVLSGEAKGKNPGDLWSIPTQPSSDSHYAMWPEKLVKKMILCSTKAGDIVCDPFCGSATTGKVTIQLQRKFIGIDLGYSDIQGRKTTNVQVDLMI